MAALHLVSRSPADSRSLEQCLARTGEGDAVLLLEDAVYAVAWDSPALAEASRRVALRVLAPDLEARGLDASRLPEGVVPVDYRGFVALTVDYTPILSWF
jgi:tRNA 2-thiouridine synthesizing protein B